MYKVNYLAAFKNIHQIHQHQDGNFLYLGDYSAALDVTMLKTKNIKTVLTAAAGLPLDYTSHDINHTVYMALDIPTYNISKHFTNSYEVIQNGLKIGSVFVHCAAGISRSSTIVIAYLMKKYNWTFQKAFNYVRSKRKIICPNTGFQRHLKNYQRTLKKDTPLNATINEENKMYKTKLTKIEEKTEIPIRATSTVKKPFNINMFEEKKVSMPPVKRLDQPNLNLKIVTIKK